MTYSREKYLSNKFDVSNIEEVKIYQKIINENLSGLKYNLFMKDYIIEKIRNDLMSIDFFKYQETLGNLIYKLFPLIQMGMFTTTRKILESTLIPDEAISKFKYEWINILEEANDIK